MDISIFLVRAVCLLSLCFVGCETPVDGGSAAEQLKVISHRAVFGDAPENAMLGILRCIEAGVDMVEVDIRLTKDSVLLLMHDSTLDRTTNGSGYIHDWESEALRSLKLKNADGTLSEEGIPSFEEVMLAAKNKIEVFVDKGYELLPQAYETLRETGTLDQAHFLGFVAGDQFKLDYPRLSKKLRFMPLVLPSDTIEEQLKSYSDINVAYYLFSFDHENEDLLKQVAQLSPTSFAMATTQTDKYCAGHSDSLSRLDPSLGWGWIIDQGFDAICTDYPEELMAYLKMRERSN